MPKVNAGQLLSPIKTLEAVQARLTEAVLSRNNFNHPALMVEVRRMLGSSDVESGALAQEPVIEAAFPYITGEETFGELSGGLLHPIVVDALSRSGPDRQYVFPRTLKPYAHQVKAWSILQDPTPQSVLVTSGTGSGKTECFVLPILNDLAQEVDAAGRLAGVRAIALYPLNALIASQEERLREWTAPFKGQIRFGLYNGLMPDDTRSSGQRPEQVEDRRTLRSDPPPILVTNITMLEYMTVRKQDRPLIEASSGKLRWIILDEAHSYIGSRAAEVALLIRRVLLTFNVKPTDVRFVATSATIGEGGDVEKKLREFLRDIAGVPEERVHVIVGHLRKPVLPAPRVAAGLSIAELSEPEKLSSNPVVQNLMRLFDAGPMKWSKFSELSGDIGVPSEELAQAFAAKLTPGSEPLLPMRAHGFIRGVQGVWTCINPACSHKPSGWAFGAILPEAVQRCPHCRSAVLEIERCGECGEPVLAAVEKQGRLTLGYSVLDSDEFAADSENERAEVEETEESPEPEEIDLFEPEIARIIGVRDLEGGQVLHVDPVDGKVHDTAVEGTIVITSYDRSTKCPACDGEPGRKKKGGAGVFQKFRSGAPFLVGNAAPVLLDGVAPREGAIDAADPTPDGGRQLLSFTDSRQGTARFAAVLQNGSERNFVRAAIYHAVQDTLRPQPGANEAVAKKNQQIKELEKVVSTSPMLSGLLETLKYERDALISPSDAGLNWALLREQLSVRPEIEVQMRRVWRFRDERFLKSNRGFTEFLMLRELARRPRLAIALETFGLARLRYPVIEQLHESRLPRLFKEKGLSIADYRDFLMMLMSINVRGIFAIRTDRENIHWFSGQAFQRRLIPPGLDAGVQAGQTSDRGKWPVASGRSIVVRLLERVLELHPDQARDHVAVDEILQQAWQDLLPLFAQPGAGGYYALEFDKVNVAPVKRAFLCPVTRRLSDLSFGGLSPFGFGSPSRFSGLPAEAFEMPVHPNPFLLEEHGGAEVVHSWLAHDPDIARLRGRGLWTNLHDRIALESPYFRAAEHSAQQPPTRLRAYEKEFKEGRINILNCSTTMEMGVDIGSVAVVMMTNVPPSLANYRQRIGRAGRRGQGFALALTYARPSPLDRETFRDPVGYLNRRIEAPKVTLDSKRIVQRHVNALLLAGWFKSAGGEALKTNVGDFFGCPAAIGGKREAESAATQFQKWTQLASVVTALSPSIAVLVRGSALESDPGLFMAAAEAMRAAEAGFVAEWDAAQAQAATMDREVAKKSLGFQIKRMCGENLIGELADRGVLPGHGFPTDVVSFVNKDQPDQDERDDTEDRFRRRKYPSRNLDLAIRDYAPGAEVVIDGLVYESAGVTLNWKRPAGDSDVNEIQSLKWFWECAECGDAGTSQIRPDCCISCAAKLHAEDVSRFLRPAGFTVDMTVKPHAEIDEVSYVEPEPERVSARKALWQTFPNPSHGRVRSSREGMVYYSSRGGTKQFGYSVCLECGRAEADPPGVGTPAFRPLLNHRPLRFTRADADGKCPGNARPFSIVSGLALGHEISTDVVEIQPARLSREKAAWALASALREALARRLGVESTELGIAVDARSTPVGGRTHSIFLYDRAAGGAGFAPRLLELFTDVLHDARAVLACSQPGCMTGCSSCVLTSDLAMRADLLDRKAALEFLDQDLGEMGKPDAEDLAAADALLSLDVADELLAHAKAGEIAAIWLWGDFNPGALTSARMGFLIGRLRGNGASVVISFADPALSGLDASQKLSLRDAAIRHDFQIATGGAPVFGNGATALASLSTGRIWATRDENAGLVGDDWGVARAAPIVWFDGVAPTYKPVDLTSLLPASGTRYTEFGARLNGASRTFDDRFIDLIGPELAQANLWRSGKLTAIEYSDRYINSPLAAQLVVKAVSVLARKLAGGKKIGARIVTAPLRALDAKSPYRVNHDWQDEDARADVIQGLAKRGGLDAELDVGTCPHSRRMRLVFEDGEALIVFDQGFGYLRTEVPVSFDFRATASDQEKRLSSLNLMLKSDGSSFFVITPGS